MELKAMSRYFRFCAVACLAAFGLAASEHHGVVKFGTLPIPGATVTATKDDKKVVAITDDNGVYSFPDLEDGTWKVRVEMLTFAPAEKEIGIVANAPGAEWDLKLMSMDDIKPMLQAASAPTTPPVNAAAPATSTTPGTTAPAATGTGQPTPAPAAANAAKPAAKGKNGKNAAPTTPQPGFQRTDVNASSDSAALSNTPSIASADPTQTASDAMVVNGSTSNGIERRVIGNGRKGPRSLYTGGFDVRNFHNDLLDARAYSITGINIPRTPQTQYTAAGNVQGPLWIPHVFRWTGNFFINVQTTRNRSASNAQGLMPTTAERTGDFSQLLDIKGSPVTVLDPTTGNPFPNDMIPGYRISQQAQYLLKFYPLPQFAGTTYNFESPVVTHSVNDQLSVRINKPLDAQYKNTLNAAFSYGTGQTTTPNGSGFAFQDTNHSSGYNTNASLNHTFTRLLRGQLTVNYSRFSSQATPFFANKTNVSGLAGITGNDQTPFDWGPPGISFADGSNIPALSDGNPSSNRNQTAGAVAQIFYNRRPHNFTFRAEYTLQDFSAYSQNNGRGTFTFTGLTPGFQTGLGFASFLLGQPDNSQLAFGNADKYLRSPTYGVGVSDDWRVSSSLSLTWAVRWDYSAPITEKYNRLVNLDIAPGFTSAVPVVANQSLTGSLSHMQYPSSLINSDKHEFQPRVGFAWKPIFGSSMLLKGGYGIYYNTSVYNSLANDMIQQSPLSKSLNVPNSLTSPLTLANGFVANPNILTDNYAIDPNFRVGYAQIWYLSDQQNITPGTVVTVTYQGTKGTRAVQEFQPNTYPVGAVNPCSTCLSGYTYFQTNGNSTRNAGTIQIRRRFHGGFNSQVQYTFAKAIDDAGSLGTSGGVVAQNWLNLDGERGLSNTDQRHNVQVSFSYSTGVGVHGGALLSGWRGLIIKGWTISGVVNAGSGFPITPLYASTTLGNSNIRPEYIGGSVYSNIPGLYLNPAAFAAPPSGQWGDAARNMLIGPNQFSFNMQAARSFAEHLTATFNSSNVLNHPVFTGVNRTFNPNLLNGGSFGTFQAPSGMRVITATLRWTF